MMEIQTEEAKIEQNLANEVNRLTGESNRAETEVSKQILFLAGATLALLGGLMHETAENPSKSLVILLTLAVIALTLSIISGVTQFCLEYLFWRRTRDYLMKARDETRDEPDLNKKRGIVKFGYKLANDSSNRIAFWIQIISFILSVVLLSTVIILRIVN